MVFLNGAILGIHKRPKRLVAAFRQLRRAGRVGEFVSIFLQARHRSCVNGMSRRLPVGRFGCLVLVLDLVQYRRGRSIPSLGRMSIFSCGVALCKMLDMRKVACGRAEHPMLWKEAW